MSLQISLTENPKTKPVDESKLGFGQIFTDHMFLMDYEEGKGWFNPRILPYSSIELDPSAMIFHYGQAIFEGMKAYRTSSDEIHLFRPLENMNRINFSNQRMQIPQINPEEMLSYLKALVDIDRDWVPGAEQSSLYIRPFIIATDAFLGVKPSSTYKFMIILSPSGAYYPQGLNPVNIFVETEYVRAVKGGTGNVKTPGNYAAGLAAQKKAQELGYVQVLWLDALERRYVEEVGAMNVFFLMGDRLVTPSLDGSILPGITRKTVLELSQSWGYKVEERKISIDEVYEKALSGEITEAFGSGTAAVISPIGELFWEDKQVIFNRGQIGSLSQKLYDEITGIQYGKLQDKYQWIVKV